MPTLIDRVTDFFKPKKPYQQQTDTAGNGASSAPSRGPNAVPDRKPAAKKAKPRKAAAKKAAAKKPARKAAAKKPATKKPAKKTRQQLYREAAKLKVPGRTKMSKAQLERAVTKAKQK